VFSQDSKLVASGSSDRTVRIWDASQGALLHTLEGHSNRVKSVVFSQDSKLVASGANDNNLVRSSSTERDDISRAILVVYANQQTFVPYPERPPLIAQDGIIAHSSLRLRQIHKQHAVYSLDDGFQWVKFGLHKILWLPPNIRPSSLAGCGFNANTMMLANSSGRMTWLRFDPKLMSL